MVSVRTVPESDLDAAHRLHERFTGQDVSIGPLRERYEDTPELFVGAYDDDELVGICLGWMQEDGDAELAGLGVDPSLRREGVGSRLVATFEENASDIGIEHIGLGSAGGYVDQFYAENGYTPKSILVRSDPDGLPVNYREMGFDVVDESIEGDTKKVYVDATDLDPPYLEEVREAFDDEEAIYIMEKAVRR